MKRIFRHRPSPAMVVACTALTVALGGTSYAAVTLPKNSVGANQLRQNAVTSSKVKNDTIKGADVLESSLGPVTSAANAANAAHATSSDNATNATNAMNATSATNATTAANATNAMNATSATNATNAANATNAVNATNAKNADAVNGRAANGLVRAATGVQATSLQTPPSTAWVTAAQATITAPGPGYAVVSGAIDITLISGVAGTARARLHDSVGLGSPVLLRGTDLGADLSPTYVFEVTAAGARTYQLQFRSGGASWTWQADNGMITALYVPFGGTGNTP